MAFTALTGVIGLLSLALSAVIALDGLSPERTVHRIHDLGGAIAGAVIGVGFLASAIGRGRWPAALQQIAAAAVGFLAVDLLTGGAGAGAVMLVILVALAAALHPQRSALLAAGRFSPILGAMALAGSVLLAWYAAGQIALQRAAHHSEPHGLEGHYADMAFMALTLALVMALASLRTAGWRIPAWTSGGGLAAFGLAVLATPLLSGSPGRFGAIMAIVGGAAFIAVAEIEARRRSAAPVAPADALADSPAHS